MRISPDRLLILSFAGLILAGTLALSLPGSGSKGALRWDEALFTSTSAVCVTGLTVIDVGKDCSFQGQATILLLIQLGGLGILTFSSWLLLAMGLRLSVRGSEALSGSFHTSHHRGLPRLIGRIVLYTFAAEGIGALLLWARLAWQEPPFEALFSALFHAISAYCNAGFSLYSDSLISFRGDAAVNFVVMGLITVGGIGFAVQAELVDRLRSSRRRRRRLSLHTRLVLVVSAALVLIGAGSFLVLEHNNALLGLPAHERLFASVFQSVTCRTAGFNTVPIGRLTSVMLCIMMFLMFVGASPGSTGGGVKTTTLGVLVALVASRMRGRTGVEAYGRQIPRVQVAKAIGVFVIGLVAFAVFLFGLEISESIKYGQPYTRAKFLDYTFEVVSAMGTVGLSTGVTPTLTTSGRLIIVLAMFAGRVGPLTLAYSLIGERVGARYEYPEENVMIG